MILNPVGKEGNEVKIEVLPAEDGGMVVDLFRPDGSPIAVMSLSAEAADDLTAKVASEQRAGDTLANFLNVHNELAELVMNSPTGYFAFTGE